MAGSDLQQIITKEHVHHQETGRKNVNFDRVVPVPALVKKLSYKYFDQCSGNDRFFAVCAEQSRIQDKTYGPGSFGPQLLLRSAQSQ